MFEPLERMVLALWQNDVSQTFSILIGLYFIFAIFYVNTDNHRCRILVSNAPGALTSLGILGTFFGIFLALMDFDIRLINKSVPTLLEGLKVAFGTSILGLAAAFLFRFGSPFLAKEPSANEEATIEDIVTSLKAVETSVNDANVVNREGLESLQRTLTDEKDTSIVGQLQRLRGSISDLESSNRSGFEAQIKEFREFADHMSEAFSKAIIDELKSVIQEFNEKISEQFGENFKQLNVGVGRLLEWQEQYRQQMDQLKIAFDNAVAGIQSSRDAFSHIEASAENIPAIIEKMEEANNSVTDQIAELVGHLGAFAEIREKAIDAFPIIEENIENITTNIRTAVEQQSSTVETITKDGARLISDMTQASEHLTETFGDLRTTTKQTIDNVNDDVTKMSQSFSENISNASESMTSEVTKITLEISESVERIGTDLQELVDDNLTKQRAAQSEMLEGFQASFTEAMSNTTNNMQDSLSEQRTAQREMLEGLQTSFNETISNATSSMNEAIVQLDEAMQNEIESVVRAMAENLSGISERFVADYNPLLENTRRIVELSERASRNE